MCRMAGFCDYYDNLMTESPLWGALAKRMTKRMSSGKVNLATEVSQNMAIACTNPVSFESTVQPYTHKTDGAVYTVCFDGYLFNLEELKKELQIDSKHISTVELVLECYLQYGPLCAEHFHGVFTFLIADSRQRRLVLSRDLSGARSLYYTLSGDRFIFGSEIKALFEYPGISHEVKKQGIYRLFSFPGAGAFSIFDGIFEIQPGHCIIFDCNGIRNLPYFELEPAAFHDSYEAAVFHLQNILKEPNPFSKVYPAISINPVPSTLIKNTANKEHYHYLLTFEDSIELSNVIPVTCKEENLIENFYDATVAKDIPSNSPMDAALLHFCRSLSQNHQIVSFDFGFQELLGICPESPYPHYQDCLLLLKPELVSKLEIENCDFKLNSNFPLIESEQKWEQKERHKIYHTLYQIIIPMLENINALGNATGLTIIPSFADDRIMSYCYNIPYSYKKHDEYDNALLIDIVGCSFRSAVPTFPTIPFYPNYHQFLVERFTRLLKEPDEPVYSILNQENALKLLTQVQNTKNTLELLKKDSLLAYFIQVNFWMKRYDVSLLF